MVYDRRQVDSFIGLADDRFDGLDASLRPVSDPQCVDPLSFLSPKVLRSAFKPVVNYLGCLGALTSPANDFDSEDLAPGHLQALRSARLFDMGMTLHDFHKKACELVCNLYGFTPPPLQNKHTINTPKWREHANAYEAFLTKVHELPASAVPKPITTKPFESIFLHCAGPIYSPFGAAIRVSNESSHDLKDFLEQTSRAIPLGFLVSDEGIVEYMMAYDVDAPAGTTRPMITYALLHWTKAGGWLKQQTLVPWIVTLMIGYLNSHNTVVHGKFSKREQHDFMKESKRLPGGPVRPRDFYTLTMHRQTFELSAVKVRKSLESRARKYRVDVRGHETVRVMRGKLPLTPQDEKKLRDRGYRIYEATELSEDDRLRLEHRDMPARKPGEWIAVLSWWRDSFMSPANPELPYVPAVRRPTEPVIS